MTGNQDRPGTGQGAEPPTDPSAPSGPAIGAEPGAVPGSATGTGPGAARALVAGIGGRQPRVADSAYTAPTSVVLGDVVMGPRSSLWYHAVLRGDCESISIGEGSNVQDNCSVHADLGFPVRVGANVTVGHNAVLHGCVVEDDVLVGMGATVLNGARIGTGSLVAAASLVPQGMVVPPYSLVAGVPAKVRRELTEEERAGIRRNAEHYVTLIDVHREVLPGREAAQGGESAEGAMGAPGARER